MSEQHDAQLFREGYRYAYGCICGWSGTWGSMASAGADLVRHFIDRRRRT